MPHTSDISKNLDVEVSVAWHYFHADLAPNIFPHLQDNNNVC